MHDSIEIHLRIAGILLISLSLIHTIFPRYFNWSQELKLLSPINRQMMIVHTFFIALVVFLMGILCLTSTKELIETNLGKSVSLGFAVFWTVRLLVQFFGYAPSLWKRKKFETIVHIVFSFLWMYLGVLFWSNYLTDLTENIWK